MRYDFCNEWGEQGSKDYLKIEKCLLEIKINNEDFTTSWLAKESIIIFQRAHKVSDYEQTWLLNKKVPVITNQKGLKKF